MADLIDGRGVYIDWDCRGEVWSEELVFGQNARKARVIGVAGVQYRYAAGDALPLPRWPTCHFP